VTGRQWFVRNPDAPPREVWSYANQGTGLTRHGKCSLVWWQSGNYTSHCAGCCRTFTSLAGFDAHQELDTTGRVVCHDPAGIVDDQGRLRFGFERGHHYGETAPGYWTALPASTRTLPGPGIRVWTTDEGVFPE
jgi:hypothetical protein